MPAFIEGMIGTQWGLGARTGRRIHVDSVVGSDTNGDGTEGAPYATLGTGFSDVRDEKGDAILASGTFEEPSIAIVQKSSWGLIGPATIRQASTAVAGGTAPTAYTRVTVNFVFQYTRVASMTHGLNVGDAVLFWDVEEKSDFNINGVHIVQNVNDVNTFDVAAARQPPGTGGIAVSTLGRWYLLPIGIKSSNDILISEISFDPQMAALDNVSGLGLDDVNRGFITGCTIGGGPVGTGTLGIESSNTVALGALGVSNALRLWIEGNFFSPFGNSLLESRKVSPIYVSNAAETMIANNTLDFTPTGTAEPDVFLGYINVGSPPVLHLSVHNNRVSANVKQPSPPLYDNLFYDGGGGAGDTATLQARTFFKQNQYADIVSGVVQLDANNDFQDDQPNPAPVQDYQQHYDHLGHGALIADVLARTAGTVTRDALGVTFVTADDSQEATRGAIDGIDDHLRGTIRINTSTNPWREEHFDVATGLVVVDAFDLFDTNDAPINNANPLTNYIRRRQRV